jgi:chromosome segregation ATPase
VARAEGTSKAVITVTICNEGYGAYKSDVYDPDIVIERTITKTGGGYKFRGSKDGRTVATKREELAQILASLNVNVDSPLTVLTQDQARSFLSNADDAQLYRVSPRPRHHSRWRLGLTQRQFFLNGTGLQSLYDSYQRIEQDFQKLKVFKQRSLESVPDLEARVASLERKVQASRLIIEQGARKDLICNELAWAYVLSKEKVSVRSIPTSLTARNESLSCNNFKRSRIGSRRLWSRSTSWR